MRVANDSTPDAARLRAMQILADLYASEINFRIAALYDCGFDVKLGDELNGFVDQQRLLSLEEAAEWLRVVAIRYFPNSDFAKKLGSRSSG